MLVAEVNIPQMFTAYAEDLGYPDGYTHLHHFQYYCKECNQAFMSAWGKVPGSLQWRERGSYFYCPNCGIKHEKNVVCIKRQVPAPNKVRLSVKAYRDTVTLEVASSTILFEDKLRIYTGKYKESFRFDIAGQTVKFINDVRESAEIGNPFKLEVLEKSILGFFTPSSLANSKQRTELIELLKVLRESVHARLEKHLGHKIPSMYISPGQVYGTFLLPILNIAYRMMFPDAPNLPVIYRENPDIIHRYWEAKMISDPGFMADVIALTRRKTDFITAMAAVNSLPDRPTVRRILGEDPFEAGFLAEAFALCQNYDYGIRLYAGLKKIEMDRFTVAWNADLLFFLRAMLPLYDEAGIVHLVEDAKELELLDSIHLYKQLSKENREAIQAERVRIRDLHDWMARRHRLQNHVNLKFDVPEHIVKRLSMQTDRMKFFLPAESIELLEAGAKLHNCVASYGSAMKDNKKWIVLVADDKGKLVACLEVRGKELVQAKDGKNKPVANHTELNEGILNWAREAKIEIKTEDVRVKTEEAAAVAS